MNTEKIFMKCFGNPLIAAALIGIAVAPLSAQSSDTPSQEAETSENDSTIIVEGIPWPERREEIERQSEAVILPGRTREPVPRYHDKFCLTTWGLDEAFAAVLVERINANARDAGVRVDDNPDCRPNALVSIVSDVEADFETLRKEQSWIFGELKDFQIDRAKEGSGAVVAWNVTEKRGKDGTPFATVDLRDFDRERPPGQRVASNTQRSASLGRAQIRQDMIFSATIFDEKEIGGLSIRQLADFATMRLLATLREPEAEPGAGSDTILSLFAFPETAPGGLSDFDRALLKALYQLPATALEDALIDATSSEYRRQLQRDAKLEE